MITNVFSVFRIESLHSHEPETFGSVEYLKVLYSHILIMAFVLITAIYIPSMPQTLTTN